MKTIGKSDTHCKKYTFYRFESIRRVCKMRFNAIKNTSIALIDRGPPINLYEELNHYFSKNNKIPYHVLVPKCFD